MISLVLPAFNARATIERSWAAVSAFVRAQPEPWEALFVCDGDTDGTAAILEDLAADGEEAVRVLSYSPNRGKGYAVRCGLLAARGDWRIFTDVDLAYSFADIRKVAETLMAGAEVAIAAREHPDSDITLPPHLLGYAYRRRWQSRVFGALARTLLPLAQRDTQAGLKGLSAKTADWLLPHMRCDGFGFDCELLAACRQHHVDVSEVPVTMRLTDTVSTTGRVTVLRMIYDLWRARRRLKTLTIPPPAPAAMRPLRRAA